MTSYISSLLTMYRQAPRAWVFDWSDQKHRRPPGCVTVLFSARISLTYMAEGDMRRNFTRFKDPEAFKHNLVLVDTLKAIADKKGVTPAQLCISWVASLGPKVIPMPGSR